MPYKSRKQEAFFNANRSKMEAQGVDVNEWNQASKGLKLPEKAMKSRGKMGKNWIAGAVSHPGALTAAAKEHGVSKLEEAEKESHSSNPRIRARGNLGKRFIKKTI